MYIYMNIMYDESDFLIFDDSTWDTDEVSTHTEHGRDYLLFIWKGEKNIQIATIYTSNSL